MAKTRLTDLAVCGGPPAFDEPRLVGRPNLPSRAKLYERLDDILDRRWLTNNGRYVRELEQRLGERLGVKHCLAISNGTTALEILFRAANLSGEVIVPSFTFIATVHALHWLGLKPVFCDVDPATHNLDPAQVENLITPRTSAILGVHLWGRACAVDDLTEIAARYNLALLYDSAHAFGCSWRGRHVGSFGRAEVFSFHATKFFHTLEGGAITTNDEALAGRIRLMRNFGFAGFDNVVEQGINGKLDEFSAAMGVTLLESTQDVVNLNRRNYTAYRHALAGLPGLSQVSYDEREHNNYQYIVVDVDESVAGLSRDELVRVLHAENVIARRYFYPGCHRMMPYRELYPEAERALPETVRLSARLMCLPTGDAMSQDDIEQLAGVLRLALGHAPEVRLRLAGGNGQRSA